MDYDAYDAILQHLYKRTFKDAWAKPSEENNAAGVCVRVAAGHFRVFPYESPYLVSFEEGMKGLNPAVALKVRSAAVHAAMYTAPVNASAIYLDSETRIQVIDSMLDLPNAEKDQCGAFLRDERVLVLWSDNLESMIPIYNDFQRKMISLLLRSKASSTAGSTIGSRTPRSSPLPSVSSQQNLNAPILTPFGSTSGTGDPEKTDPFDTAAIAVSAETEKAANPSVKPRASFFSRIWSKKKHVDSEKAAFAPRPQRLFAPFYGGLAAGLAAVFIGSGLSTLLAEFRLGGGYVRFALLITAPFLFCVALFFCLQLINNIAFCIGPVEQFHENSKYYSAVKPLPNEAVDDALPHVTIEMPVYKESLEQTIVPSVFSIKKAMQTYARQGGTSNIFIHDDGLQLISEEERLARIEFYADHNIGWVARPKHDSGPEGYKRAGRFKKASNMNAGLLLSLRMEALLLKMESGEIDPTTVEGETLEDKALNMAIDEEWEKSGQRWRFWGANAKSCRVGEIILIIDSDTIVPEDCFRDAARELAECPEVAIIQHESDVMQVAHNYFEDGIAHFTRRINKCISVGCSNGEVAPFVGHNAFLRWSAIQDAAFVDPADGIKKIWSESNVSEDFDMALRLQLRGFSIRWATYSLGGFKEGVSLTADDELNRWQKYAYGCNELIFNPMVHWWKMGPITKQLRIFIWSDAPVHYKISMMSYMFSYYGIAIGFLSSVLNFFLLGWSLPIDGFYQHSLEIWLACIFVFPISGNIGFTLLEYRLGQRSLLSSFCENIYWVPFFFFFFSGISIHVSTALLAHCVSYDITWGATKKEVERSNFFVEVPRILKRFWLAFLLSFGALGLIVVLTSSVVPMEWAIDGKEWGVYFPMAVSCVGHIAFPLVLNPYLMVFSY